MLLCRVSLRNEEVQSLCSVKLKASLPSLFVLCAQTFSTNWSYESDDIEYCAIIDLSVVKILASCSIRSIFNFIYSPPPPSRAGCGNPNFIYKDAVYQITFAHSLVLCTLL